jgi:predicted ATPase/DNA-binding SARP family transcriptional activator
VALDVRLLGPLELSEGERALPLAGGKARALLIALALRCGEVVSSDELAEALWEGSPPETVTATLQMHIAKLRKTLGQEAIATEPPGYRLTLSSEAIDARRFERRLAAGRAALRAADPERAARLLSEALALWRGPALADVAYAEFAQSERTRLEELRLEALEERIEADLARGRAEELVGELEALVAEHPLRERLRGQLLLALYRAGRQGDAHEAYQDTRRTLLDELGIDPSPDLQELQRRILNQDPGLLVADTPETQGPRLPVPATPLVGRERELAELAALLASREARLVTLTGPGGVGKTRLALEVARRADDELAAGAHFLALAAIRDPELVLPEIARSYGVAEAGELPLPAAIAAKLGEPTLLVLDNFEQVVEAAADVSWLVAAAPVLRVLVTSRERLRVRGERELALAPLEPSEAVELFCARAEDAGTALERTPLVRELCARLDSLPLALELAAARVKVLSPEKLLERLTGHLDLLQGARDSDPRQQTLRATIEWSYELLTPAEQQLFARLSVFQGGCTLEAAEGVCEADLDTLQSLVEKSLLRYTKERYWMLETIREYAHGLLEASDESKAIRSAHVDWCLRSTHDAGHVDSASEISSLERLESERDNLRAALSWALDSDRAVLALELAVGLIEFWEIRGPLAEGRAWLEHALDGAHGAPRELRVRALHVATALAARQGDHDAMATLAETQLALAREAADHRDVVRALVMLATVAGYRGDTPEALERSEEAVAIATEAADPRSLLTALNCRGILELEGGEYAAAGGLFERCLELARLAGGRRDSVATAEFNVAFASLLAGDEAKAVEHLEESLRIYRALRHFDGVGYCFVVLGALAARKDDLVTAARTLGAAEVLLDEVGAALEPPERALYARTLKAARTGLEPDTFAQAWSDGKALADAELAVGASE